MCGRFALSITPAQFRHIFGCAPREIPARYNITPGSAILVIRLDKDGQREAVAMRWGLLPPWSSDPADPARQINARIETAAEKPMFRAAFRRSRCLVPADGFYEWQKLRAGLSQPYFVRMRDGRPMAFAGLWRRTELADGSELDTCAILTMEALPAIRGIHHRMPVIVPFDRLDAWLDPTLRDPKELRELVTGCEAEIEAVPVSRRVDNPRHEGPGLIEPIAEMAPALRPEPKRAAQGSLF